MTAPAPRGRAEPRGWLGNVVLLAPKFVLTHRLPRAAQRPIHVATHVLIAGFGALAVWYGVQLAIVNSALNSPALEINLAWVYVAPAVGGGLIVLYALAAAFEPPPLPDPGGLDETGIAAAGDD